MRFAALLLVPALFAAEPQKLPAPLQSIADLANTAPPEFGADALLKIVESGKLADRNARRDLVEHAFQLAASAKLPVRMKGLPGTTTDTASGSMTQAYDLRYDVVSLQSRAVRDMLPLDPAKARELFGQIVKPTLAPLTCDDALVYEPSEFYSALSAVVNGAFTAKEKAKEEHFNLLVDALGQISSPSQLAPLAGTIEGVSVAATQRQILWARFTGLLESMQPDDRSFAASLTALGALSMPGIQPSLEKYRQKNHGCETDAAPSPAASPRAGVQPPPRKPATPKLDLYWQSAAAQRLLQAGKKLRYGPNTVPYSDADRATPQWQQQLADYLNLIADWTPDQEASDAIYYHEKCLVYTSLFDLVPAGPQSDKIVADFVDFIGNSSLYQQSPSEWYVEALTLLNRSVSDLARHAKIVEAFQESGNPVLTLELAINRTFENKPAFGAASSR